MNRPGQKDERKKGRTTKSDRFGIVYALVVLLFLGVITRLAYLQILQSDKYSALAESQRTQTSDLLPRRGTIYLSEGEEKTFPVSTTRKDTTVYMDPRDIDDLDTTVEKLVNIIYAFNKREDDRKLKLFADTGQYTVKEVQEKKEEKDSGSSEEKEEKEKQLKLELSNNLKKRLGNPTDPYELLIPSHKNFDEEAIKELKEANLKGLKFQDYSERYYPEGTLAAQLLGFVRPDGINTKGEYGIEGGMNSVLEGRTGFLEAERDVVGRWISVSNMDVRPAEDGADVVLTIDRVVQTITEQVAKNGRDKFSAEKATIIVMDPYSGEIKALANYPTFDPNYFGDIRDVSVLRNSATHDLFEPGSIFKPLVMSIAMDLGLVTPDTTMEDKGPLKIGKFTINTFDGKHLGTITMTRILEQSNNVGMVWVAEKIGAEDLFSGLRRFGIGDKTGLPLDGEAARALPQPDTWTATRLATISFGQGVVVTPLQMLVSDSALINGGKLMEPHIVKEIRYPNGRVDKTQPKVIRQVVSPETATRMSAMMTSVVENGVAGLAKVKGYYTGGKTGTAQVADSKTGRYSADRKIISFFGFAPAEKPKFSVLIVLDNPAGLSFASGTAAPMFHDLASRLLDYYMVPPTRTDAQSVKK